MYVKPRRPLQFSINQYSTMIYRKQPCGGKVGTYSAITFMQRGNAAGYGALACHKLLKIESKNDSKKFGGYL
jgi:hypothetical protein